jgi:lipoprotein-anchoring transpeptidase ErfK/SrfK
MPWALRIYGTVWIHAGDVTRGYCSPGCIVLPLETAEQLFDWADMGTAVLIVESLATLNSSLKQYSMALLAP